MMNLRYLIIKVEDLNRAKDFYTNFLKMEPTKEEPGRMIVYNLGNIKVDLYNPLADNHQFDKKDIRTNCFPAFGVDDVEAEKERISAFETILSHKKVDYHEWFEFEDTEGNLLEVHKI